MKKVATKFRLDAAYPNKADEYINLERVGDSRPYLWIGNDLGGCYGTLSGKKTLRRLAYIILVLLDREVISE